MRTLSTLKCRKCGHDEAAESGSQKRNRGHRRAKRHVQDGRSQESRGRAQQTRLHSSHGRLVSSKAGQKGARRILPGKGG